TTQTQLPIPQSRTPPKEKSGITRPVVCRKCAPHSRTTRSPTAKISAARSSTAQGSRLRPRQPQLSPTPNSVFVSAQLLPIPPTNTAYPAKLSKCQECSAHPPATDPSTGKSEFAVRIPAREKVSRVQTLPCRATSPASQWLLAPLPWCEVF